MSEPDSLTSLAAPVAVNRVRPLLIAGACCATASVLLGFGAWFLVGGDQVTAPPAPVVRHATEETAAPVARPVLQEIVDATTTAVAEAGGEVTVEAGVVELGGDADGKQSARRVFVEAFRISETEVTSKQYLEFVRATRHSAPAHWWAADSNVPDGAPQEPVTGVTWQDAADYCRWLSEKSMTEVRLPTEAEWVHAAAGPQKLKYPWGNHWDERAAAREIKGGAPHIVKRFPLNKSFYGAYDMAGNVWEWVASDSTGEINGEGNTPLKIIKGGALDESAEMIGTAARAEVPADSADRLLGFRYVVAPRPNDRGPRLSENEKVTRQSAR